MFSDYFLFRVSLDLLGSFIPISYNASPIKHQDRIILYFYNHHVV